jgi:putative DNA primase/helicase
MTHRPKPESRRATPGGPFGTDERLSELGNARRFARLVGRDVRYVAAWGRWLVWTDTHWRRDDLGVVERYAQHVVESLHMDAALEEDPGVRRALAKHALDSDSARAIRGLLTLARSQYGIPVAPEDLDRDAWLLNCLNGTLDLRTGTLRPHRREDFITRLVPVAYDPAAACTTFEAFLDRIFAGRDRLISFVQRMAGYSLTGETREQCFFVLHGPGANGKSTLVGALMGLFDAYAAQMAAETLLMRRGDVALVLNDLSTLEGKRLVAAVESDMGRRLAEALVKQLTGGDRLKVRRLYADAYEIAPTFKLWLSTNHKPTIGGRDLAIWRRVRLVPFNVTIPLDEQDPCLAEKLEAERPGILAWAVRGCLQWQRDGLGPPEEVRHATASYRAEEDALADFLVERCWMAPEARGTVADLYSAYGAWAKDSGETPMSKRDFCHGLDERGFPPGQDRTHAKARVRLGVRLRTPADPETRPDAADAADAADAKSRNCSLRARVAKSSRNQRPRASASADEPAEDSTSDCFDPPEEQP